MDEVLRERRENIDNETSHGVACASILQPDPASSDEPGRCKMVVSCVSDYRSLARPNFGCQTYAASSQPVASQHVSAQLSEVGIHYHLRGSDAEAVRAATRSPKSRNVLFSTSSSTIS